MEEKMRESQTNQPKVEPTPMAIPEKKAKPLTIAILLIVILLIVAGAVCAGYFLGRKSIYPRGLQPVTTQIPIDNGLVEIEVSPTPEVPVDWKTYRNEKYGFEFEYSQTWKVANVGGENPGISLSPAENHSISVQVWRVTGFGYCFSYEENKETVVGNKKAETADGIGGAAACDQPEKYANKGNTFVLIPLNESATGIPPNQIHISYDYPLSEKDKAKSNLDQILSTFKFLD